MFVLACIAALFSSGAVAQLDESPVLDRARSMGGVMPGENLGGVADRAYVSAPPQWLYVLEVRPGAFLDCGSGMVVRQVKQDGRDLAPLRCGVTLQETLVLPKTNAPAKVIIHY